MTNLQQLSRLLHLAKHFNTTALYDISFVPHRQHKGVYDKEALLHNAINYIVVELNAK